MSVIERIDKGLELYYSSLNVAYKNADNVGKFKAFCNEQYDNDDDEIKKELDADIDECCLVRFDEDDNEPPINHFPLNPPIDNEDERDQEIYRIIKHCYIYGKAPIVNDTLYTPFNMLQDIITHDNKEKYQLTFEHDSFCHILEDIDAKIHLTKSQRIHPIATQRWRRGSFLRLNERKQNTKTIHINTHSYAYAYNMIEININDQLKELIGISQHKQNKLFHRDFLSLLIDSYHRYCINTNTNKQNNYNIYGQIYWKVTVRKDSKKSATNRATEIIRRRLVSNIKSQLYKIYLQKLKESNGIAILVINGKKTKNESSLSENLKLIKHMHHDIDDLYKQALADYNDVIFKFLSSNKFYWSLQQHKGIKFFNSAFNNYKESICGALTLNNMKKINDNIFVFWMYIWCMSNVVRTYMQSGEITIPLQIDLVIISADNENKHIDNISQRFNIHNHKFETVLCDPTNIDSIRQKLESIFIKCSIKMKNKERRIVIIVDRRSRDEYFKDKYYDRIYGYKPLTKYCQIDKKNEIINAIWNTSKYLIPPPPKYKELFGAKNNKDIFVFTYFIRKKSYFTQLFEHKPDEKELELPNIPFTPLDESSPAQSIDSIQTFTSQDTVEHARPQFKTAKAKEFMQRMHRKNQLTSVELTHLMEDVQHEITKGVKQISSSKIKHQRPKTVTNLQGIIGEFQVLQNYIIQVAVARKLDSVVNMYWFYNGGYVRFEPLDLVRILPNFFDLNNILQYDEMLRDFEKYHDKLWELDDEIWMKYKEIYLESAHALEQQVKTEELGTDPKDREIIKKYCCWNKEQVTQADDIKMNNVEMKYDDDINIKTNGEFEKIIELKCVLDKFVKWRPKKDVKGAKGIVITKINNAEYAKYLNINVNNELWSIMFINDRDVCEMRDTEIIKLLTNIDINKGYTITVIGGIFAICDNSENKTNERIIKLSVELKYFLKWKIKPKKSRDKAAINIKKYGMKITEIVNNDYGVAFKETGVVQGWYINTVNEKDVANMDMPEIESFLTNSNFKNGYKIKFIYPEMALKASRVSSKKLNIAY